MFFFSSFLFGVVVAFICATTHLDDFDDSFITLFDAKRSMPKESKQPCRYIRFSSKTFFFVTYIYIFFSLSRCHARRPFTTTIDSRETLIYMSAFEPFFVALDDVACAMRSRARSKKKTGLETGREDETHSRARGNGVRTARRRSRGAVPGRISRPLFFSSNLLFWVFFVLVSCHHHHHHLSMNNNEA